MRIDWCLHSFKELTKKQLYACYQLRQLVFIVEQNCPYLDADKKDLVSHHVFGHINNELVAYLRIVFPKISYNVSIGRVVVHPDYRKKKLGKELMEKGIAYCETIYGNVAIQISAQLYLKKFYELLGFKKVSETYLEDNIPHIRMLREKNQSKTYLTPTIL